MEPLKGLALALDLADRQRLLAGKGLAQAQRAHGFSQSQLQQLQSYLSDSQTRAVRTGQTVAGGAVLQGHHRFIDRLSLAIGLQQGVLNDVQQQLERAKKTAVAAEFRKASLERVLRRRVDVQARAVARQEQQQSDEFASQRSAVRNG
jgi:flagellar export protein FliJ